MNNLKNTGLTPQQAVALAQEAALDEKHRKIGVIATGSDNEISLLCHAARHVGLPICGIKQGDVERPMRQADLDIAATQWRDFILGDETWTLSAPPITEQERQDAITEELDALIGLTDVKAQIRDVIDFVKIRKRRECAGLPSTPMGQHLVFTGNPGTGKTTIARLIGEIYKELGVLEKGQFIEIDGRGLIAEYLGQTAKKVRDTVESALGGTLFIDEAYALVQGNATFDYGPEAIATLIKLMEDHRDELVVIIAGYEDEMDKLLDLNPGLKSRFKTQISFPDYSAKELTAIFEKICCDHAYALSPAATKKVSKICAQMHAQRKEHFGNGRAVRNLFERCLILQARRLCQNSKPSKKDLQLLTEADIPKLSDLSW